MQDDPRQQHTPKAPELPETPRLSPSPRVANPDDTEITQQEENTDTDFNEVPIVGSPDSRECTTATEALQITQQGVHSSNQHTSQVADPASNIKSQTRLLLSTSKQKGEVPDPLLAGHHNTPCYYTPGDTICLDKPPARPSPKPPPSLNL